VSSVLPRRAHMGSMSGPVVGTLVPVDRLAAADELGLWPLSCSGEPAVHRTLCPLSACGQQLLTAAHDGW
jgi:hypothetical protein